MSITTKPRPGYVRKKVKAAHHRHSKTYLKPYWPYIPIIGVVALGAVANHLWHKHSQTGVSLTNYNYYDVLESSIGLMALAIFLLRHAFAWHKVLVKGEDFVANHPIFDVMLVIVATTGIVLAHNGVKFI